MRTLLKDKNITNIIECILLADETPVAVYKKNNLPELYVLIDTQEFGPFVKTDIYSYVTGKNDVTREKYIFAAKTPSEDIVLFQNGKEIPSQHMEFYGFNKEINPNYAAYIDAQNEGPSLEEMLEELLNVPDDEDMKDPFIVEKGEYCYFEVNDKSYGPYSLIWNYSYSDNDHFHFLYVSPFDETKLYYNLNGQVIASFERPDDSKTPTNPYFSDLYSTVYTDDGKPVLHKLEKEPFILVDGIQKNLFDGKCTEIFYYEKGKHFYARGKITSQADNEDNFLHCYDGNYYDNWVNTRIHSSGIPEYVRKTTDQNNNTIYTWFYGDKQISVPIVNCDDDLVGLFFFEGFYIRYLKDKSNYIITGGQNYPGTDFNKNNILIYKDDELIIISQKNIDYKTEEDLAEYLAEHGLLAGQIEG